MFSYTVGQGDAIPDIAAALAHSVDAASDYVAQSEGVIVVVSRVSGTPFSLIATPPPSGSASVDESSAGTKTVVLSGPYNPADTWGVDLNETVSSYVAQPGNGRTFWKRDS